MFFGYRWVATSVPGFVQQLAVGYLTHGHFFYVHGLVPEGKDPARVDEKLIRLYDIAVSRPTRSRRRKDGKASVHYLRYGRTFLLVASAGDHPLFYLEKASLRDFRKHPFRFHGYSISHRGGHAHVRIDRERYLWTKARLEGLAAGDRGGQEVWLALRRLPFQPYAPIKRQLFSLLRATNQVRRGQGLSEISHDALRLFRKSVRPFAEQPSTGLNPEVVHGQLAEGAEQPAPSESW